MLELVGLTRHFGANIALEDLSFSVGRGEVVGFLGPNGAGKTTAMRAALGIIALDRGEVRWHDKKADLQDRLRFGYMPEERGLYTSMKIIDQLVFLGRLHGMTRKAASEASNYWLEVLGLADRPDSRLDALSLGNQQRVQMAAALIHSPELLILDEPFSGLDPTGIESLSKVLKERAEAGAAVVFSSHQLDLVEGLCERVVIINKGRSVIQGGVEELTVSENVLSVRVEGDALAEWANSVPGITTQGIDHGNLRIRLNPGTSANAVLDAARARGSVTHFSFERKRLSEVFREAVAQ